MCHKAETANVGCKVLPICDAAQTNSVLGDCRGASPQKNEQKRPISRMKELLLRAVTAAAAKSPKRASKAWKVLNFKSKTAAKDHHQLDDSSSTSTNKLSFTWETTSCSAAYSSVYSPLSTSCTTDQMSMKNLSRLSLASENTDLDLSLSASPKNINNEGFVRNGQWITNDADFVVLELRIPLAAKKQLLAKISAIDLTNC